jgi:hypothetical protein
MTVEDRARLEVMLEELQAGVKVIAEGHLGLDARLDRMEAKTDARFEQMENRFAQLETKFDVRLTQLDTKLAQLETRIDLKLSRLEDKLDVFAVDTRRRLEHIETHLGFDGTPPAAKRPQRAATKRRKAA